MKKCRKCGGEIAFKKLKSGKWCPTEPDGSDHWDICSERRYKNVPEHRRKFLDAKNKPRYTNPENRTEFYSGDVPPWDESLGEFKDQPHA